MSNPSDRVLGTPPTNTSILPEGLIQQQREREKALKRVAKLRKKAAAEIERLLAFLDACDPYVTAELEDDGDQGDASYPESGSRMLGHPNEDDEDDADSEPSLGSSGHGSGSTISYTHSPISDGFQMVYDCEGDEHDGREPENEGGEAVREDCEPSLGWTDAESATGRHTGWGGETYDLEVDL